MSGTLPSHTQEGDNDRAAHVGDERRPASEMIHPTVDGYLPPVPPRETPTRSPLCELILRAHEDPKFIATISRLLSQGGISACRTLWAAVADILHIKHPERSVVAWKITEEICRHATKDPAIRAFEPSTKMVADLIADHPQGAWTAFKSIAACYPLNSLEVARELAKLKKTSESAKAFGFACVKEHYAELVQRDENLPHVAALLKTAVIRRNSKSLEACLFIRDKYEACRGWIGKEAEATMLWNLRDGLTKILLRAPLMCESNLKIALMYPREVPHPALRSTPQRILEVERWILCEPRYLSEGLGIDHAANLPAIEVKGEIDSSHFIYLGSFPDARFRGIHGFASRFDRDGHVLVPLARSLGLDVPGIYEASRSGAPAMDDAPRSWVDSADKERYETSQVTLACRCVEAHYWKPKTAERSRQGAYEFLRALIRQRPYQLSLAAPHLRKWDRDFYLDALRIVREEALKVWRRAPEASGSHEDVRSAVVLLDAFGSIGVEASRLAFDELTMALETPNESLMSDRRFGAFVAAMRPACVTSPTFEERALAAIGRFPGTLGASQLARNLAEVKTSVATFGDTLFKQVSRRDLDVQVWLNYAHSALVHRADDETRHRVKEALEDQYDRSVRVIARWSPKGRTSYRILVGALYPERVGDISPLRSAASSLFHSSLEARIKAAITELPGVSVESGTYIPWAPAIDGVLRASSSYGPPVVLMVDGEPYHSVNGCWRFRGFDGHSLLASKILTNAGYSVLRISGQLGEATERSALCSVVRAALDHAATGASAEDPRLVIDPPDDYRDIGGKALLYRPTAPPRGHISTAGQGLVNAIFDTLTESGEGDESPDGSSQEG